MRIRGFEIDAPAVESVLTRAPTVRQAFVDARRSPRGDLRLVGYVVPAGGAVLDPAAVTAYVRDRLPEYAVPSAVVVLDAFPLHSNGSLDRAALPAAQFAPDSSRLPRTPGEQVLCELFAELLGRPAVGIDDDFFDLGGPDAPAADLARRAADSLKIDASPAAVERAPTPAALAQLLGVGRQVLPVVRPQRGRNRVKVNGRAIAPCEAAVGVMTAPGVKRAVVAVREDRPGQRTLVAYVVADADAAPSLEEIHRHVRGELPDYMTPSDFVFLDEIPLTFDGELDWNALPAPAAAAAPTAVRSPIEDLLCTMFAEILGVDTAGADDDFFALGGNSLLAVRLTNRVRSRLGADLEVTDVFEDRTVSALARRLGPLAPPRPTAAKSGQHQ